MTQYPRWLYFPRSAVPPDWVAEVTAVFSAHQMQLDTTTTHNKSNVALSIVREGLEGLGFHVEGGKHEKTIHRPVHFGEFGKADRQYQIDSYHPRLKVGLEIVPTHKCSDRHPVEVDEGSGRWRPLPVARGDLSLG